MRASACFLWPDWTQAAITWSRLTNRSANWQRGKWHLIKSSVDSRTGYTALAQREMDSKKKKNKQKERKKEKKKVLSAQVNTPHIFTWESHCYIWLFPKRQYVCVSWCVCRQLAVLALEIVSRGGWGTVSSCEHLFLIETTKLVLRK